MNKIFMLLAVFAIVITVSGPMSRLQLGQIVNLVHAQEDDGGDRDGGEVIFDDSLEPGTTEFDGTPHNSDEFEPPHEEFGRGVKAEFEADHNPEGFIDPIRTVEDNGEILCGPMANGLASRMQWRILEADPTRKTGLDS